MYTLYGVFFNNNNNNLPAAQTSSLSSSLALTEATEPISPADQIPAPQVAQAVSAARGSLVDDAAQPPPPLFSSQVARISLNREIARARLLSRGPRCCKCGPSGTCSRCSCARADPPRPCSDCRAESCRQNIARPPSLSAIPVVPCDLSVSSGPVIFLLCQLYSLQTVGVSPQFAMSLRTQEMPGLLFSLQP